MLFRSDSLENLILVRYHAPRCADLIHRRLDDAVGRVVGVRDDDLALGLDGGGGEGEEREEGEEGEFHCCWVGGVDVMVVSLELVKKEVVCM